MSERVLVSRCLLGCPCRYDGCAKAYEGIAEAAAKYGWIPVCPEQSGGLPTPRTPAERLGDRVIAKDGTDVTDAFRLGAEETLRLAKLMNIRFALLKAKSPSCGCGTIYDGTHTGTLTDGNGLTAEMLLENGIAVFNEHQLDELLACVTPKRPTETVTFTNMCMIADRDRVLVLDKVSGGYTGLTFPGGHVEVGESFTDAMKREVYEETGLTVDRLHFEGVFNWTQPEGKRYVIFFYRTQCFSGELKASDEGQLRWVPWQEFMNMKLANHMDYAMKLLFDQETTEVFLDRTDPTNKDIALK